MLRRTLAAVALAGVSWAAPAAAAGASSRDEHVAGAAPTTGVAGVDHGEADRLGAAHAAAHAKARVLEERWRRLTPAQRKERSATATRQTQALNARLAGQRDDVGHWDPTLYPLPEYAINAIVLPTGKVLIFGREPKQPDGSRPNLGSARLFDPLTGAAVHVPPPPGAGEDAAPIFCAGQTVLSDGRVLIVGGNLADPGPGKPQYSGLDQTFIFDPWSAQWQTGPRMTHGRWYPTLTRLSSGDVLIAAGLDEDGQGLRNGRLDILRPGEDLATPLLDPYPAGSRADPGEIPGETLAPDAAVGLSLYPFMFTLPDGDVALAGPGQQDSAILETGPKLYDQNARPGSAWTQIGDIDEIPKGGPSKIHQGGTGAIEPAMNAFGGSWNLLAMAGADNTGDGFHLARKTVDRLVAGPGAPAWDPHASGHDPARDLNRGRLYPNNVLLPDGGIVVVGGGVGADYRARGAPEDPASAGNYYIGEPPPPPGQSVEYPPVERKQVELRRPGERTWRLGAAQREWRTYHSTAWLLPDGRVVSAGDDGNMKLTASRDNAEIYWPPYLFDGDVCALRPVIRGVGAPGPPAAPGARQWATLTYGERFGIFTEHARPGMQAVLAAPAATTHGVDMNQRVVPLAVDSTLTGGGLDVRMPAAAAIAPPGYYMLFVIDSDGTPSEARWVHVLAAGEASAERGGVTPATVSGPWPGATGRSCVNPDGSRRIEPDPAPAATDPPAPGPTSTGQANTGQANDGQANAGQANPLPPAGAAKLPAKLALHRAAIDRKNRRLEVLAPISALASGTVDVELFSAGRRTRAKARIDSRRRRIRVRRTIPAAQAASGTGILTMTYRGNAATFPQTLRLRVAARKAQLVVQRPTLAAGGRLRASGTISRRARGVVRLQLQFGDAADKARTLEFTAKIRRGRWRLDTQLPRSARDAIAARAGTLHSYTLFTGYAGARMSGEMRSYQVLPAP